MPFGTLARFFDLGGSLDKASSRVIEGDDAVLIVEEIERMLEGSKAILDETGSLFTTDELHIFTIQYRHYLSSSLTMRQKLRKDAKQNAPNTKGKITNSAEFSAAATRLFNSVERYHDDLLTSSSRAIKQDEDRLFADLDNNASESFETLISKSPESSASLLSPQISDSLSSADSTFSANSIDESDDSREVNDRFVCVTKLKLKPNSPRDPNKPRNCRRIVILEDIDDGSRVALLDRKPVAIRGTIEPGELDENDTSLLEMTRSGEYVLRTGGVAGLQNRCILRTGRDAEWVDSIIHKVSMMGLGLKTSTR